MDEKSAESGRPGTSPAPDDAMTSPLRRRPSGLGRGLNALLGEAVREAPTSVQPNGRVGIEWIATGRIHPHPEQPRRHFDDDALDELAASIRQRGLIQPVIVRVDRTTGGFQLVAGERRWRAAQRAQLHEIPAIVRDFTDAETLEVALVENIQREDLNAIEEARAYQKLASEFGHGQDALARLVGKSRSHVANLVRLLELPDAVQQAVVDGRLTMGHARALVNAPNAARLAERVAAQGLSVRQTERLAKEVRQRPEGATARSAASNANDPDIAAVEEHLSDLMGLRIRISHGPGPAGVITLNYNSLDQLDMICQRLSGERI